jgi:hypothetical protein
LSKATSRFAVFVLVASFLSLSGCISKIMKADNSESILKTEEFEKQVNIKEVAIDNSSTGTYVRLPGPEPALIPYGSEDAHKDLNKNSKSRKKPVVGRKKRSQESNPGEAMTESTASIAAPSEAPGPRQPAIEDSEGFSGRRPLIDPFRVGEKTVLEVSYFGVVAGDMTVEVKPFVGLNGRKSYHYVGRAESTSVFAVFYAIDDWFETFVDYETLIPSSYALHVKETKQLREARTLFDWTKGRAFFWDKKINEDKKLEEMKQEWDIPAYSQNVFSIGFYLRNFKMEIGKTLAMRLAHEKENLLVTTEVLRREKLSTPMGELDTVVVKPKIELNGNFKPVGDIYIWLTDDDRKFIVRMEAKIKIGKIVAMVKSLERGPP